MTYAAEPYAQFVEDLLTALTGGAIREQFRFLPELEPYCLVAPAPIIPNTVRVYGLAEGSYTRFHPKTDFLIGQKSSIVWQKASDGTRQKMLCGRTWAAPFTSITSIKAVTRNLPIATWAA